MSTKGQRSSFFFVTLCFFYVLAFLCYLSFQSSSVTFVEAQWGLGSKKAKKENKKGKEMHKDNKVTTVNPKFRDEGSFQQLDAQDFEMNGVDFEELQRLAEEYEKYSDIMPSLYGGDALGDFDFSNLSDEDINQWFDEMMNTPEVQAMMENPQLILDVMKESNLLDDPLVKQALLDNPDLLEEDNLKKLFEEGMGHLKEASTHLADAIKDPEKLKAHLDTMMEAADPEAKDLYGKLLSGDPDSLNEAIAKFDEVLKNSQEELLKIFGDPEAIEEARQKLLNDPELAYLVQNGLLEDIVKDPTKWREAVEANTNFLKGEEKDEL